MKIVAKLNPNEGGCNYSEHFKYHWIQNTKLHPACKEIEVEALYNTDIKPMVTLMDGENTLLIMSGNEINPAALQEYILGYLGLAGR